MYIMDDAWLFLKERKKQGFYREATIPDDKRKPVTKVSRSQTRHPFANRFATLALSQALADMGQDIVPETPVSGGGVEQHQMDKVFGNRGRHDYGGMQNEMDVQRIKELPLMQMLGLADTKGENVGMQDGRLKVFDPAFRTFRGHKARQYGEPIDFRQGIIMPNIKQNFKHVPAAELAELTQRVKDYRPQLDEWENDGNARAWKEGMGDYTTTRDTLTYLNSLNQDPQQTKLFQHEGFGTDPQQYNYMLEQLGRGQ